ncbi:MULTISPECIES: phage tail-collar fiber domain-containing protein [Dickeya]|uniref:Phage tail fiber protein n=1 Tax=Dickeya aquatica TaxID=1401087 RepID=A0A375A5J4_9GAMM|nr:MULTISPECIES: phage tail protein [Dickeya]SLM61283.1 Phage tail fiber protein [Dickeya aquatica]
MAVKYMTVLTQVGAAKLANATALGKMLNITHMAVGDGGGNPTMPDPAQKALINEKRRALLNALRADPANPNQIIAEQVIPENEGGFWLREIGLFDADGDLIAIANCPETYKPQLQEGSGRVQTVRMILVVSNTSAVTLKIDPAVVLATRKSVDDKALEVKAYTEELMAKHQAASNPHPQYAPLANPALTGVPTAPTAAAGTNNSQLATTAFVTAAANTVSASVSATTAANLAKKLDIADIAGIPLPWPQASAPAGWLKCNGQAFDKALYPKLAQVYPSGTLPDLRGEFIRGWDDGRGVDAGRTLLSGQSDAIGVFQATNSKSVLAFFVSTLRSAAYPATDAMDGFQAGEGFGGTEASVSRAVFRSAAETRPRNVAFNYIVRAA